MKNRAMAIGLILVLALSGSVSAVSQTRKPLPWKGKIEVENGIPVVRNPKGPMSQEPIFKLEEELAIRGGTLQQEDRSFQRIMALAVGVKGTIYVLDQRAGDVKVFDETGTFSGKIGRKGPGPGEFESPDRIVITPRNEMMVNDLNRRAVLVFDLEGRYLRQIPVTMPFFDGPKVNSKGELFAAFATMGETFAFQLAKLDSALKPALIIASVPFEQPPKVNIFLYASGTDLRWDIMGKDLIVWGAMTSPDYELFVHSPEGKLVRKIVREFDPVKLTAAEYEKLMTKWFGRIPSPGRFQFIIPKDYPPMQTLLGDDEGRIFVKRYESVEKGDRAFLDVFDDEGKFITNVLLPIRPVAALFKGGKLYTIEEDDEGFRLVKRYRVRWTS